jgi:DNA polymerase III subunit delta'
VSRQRILGHDRQRRAFANAVSRDRLGHAYLFVGPRGIGKHSFAAETARALLCENPSGDLVACDRCRSCLLMEAGNHPDFFKVVRPEEKNEIPVEVMRELCRGLSLKSARGRGKIALLEDADDLNPESANCFLKTLEEPPPHSVFFLIGTTPERQLPTVVSRCQVLVFAPLPDETVAGILRQHGITDGKLLERLVHLGHGSPGQALGLADPALWDFRKVLVNGLLQPRPDSVALSSSLVEFVADAGKENPPRRRRATQVLRLLITFFGDVLAVGLGTTPRLGDPEELAMLHKLAERISPEKLLTILERCLEADLQIPRFIQLDLVLEALLDALGVALTAK